MSELEFERAYLETLNKVKEEMEKKGLNSLGNADYIFLIDVIGIVEHSIKMTEEYNKQ
jgi:hypothetical protein